MLDSKAAAVSQGFRPNPDGRWLRSVPSVETSTEHWPAERIQAVLSRSYWFGSLSASLQSTIIAHSEIRFFRPRKSVYQIGDRVDGMYAALAGDFRSYATGDDGERMLMRLMGPGAWFGAFQLIERVPARNFEIRAASPCTAMFLPTSAYDAILAEDPANYLEFLNLKSMHMRIMIRIMVEARSNAERRTARALLRIAKMHGRKVERGVELALKLNQSDLASIVGVSRQYMNELLSRWTADGLLDWNGMARPVLHVSRIENLLTPLDDWRTEPSEGWA